MLHTYKLQKKQNLLKLRKSNDVQNEIPEKVAENFSQNRLHTEKN